ncbi:unnamed protein product [Lasius platythorax]|uniref:Uncharacterized protein n=1 Tax=Lasius platythorax TaxID=488582 RepID=A0AAV2N966_9HYME
MAIDDGARVRCSKLIFRTYARNRGEDFEEKTTGVSLKRRMKRREKERGQTRGARMRPERETGCVELVAAEQKLKCLHP